MGKFNKRALVLGLLAFLPLSPVWAQMELLGAGEVATTLGLATAVQQAVEKGNYAFVAVIVLMLGLQVMKTIFGRKLPSVKKNAAQYSAIGGALIGGAASKVIGTDPVSGTVGGLMAGNAASGLYSSIAKPLGVMGKKYLQGKQD